MNSSQHYTDIIKDISLLYELALSVGSSLDLKSNCDVFLKTLMARKNLDFASVWIKNEYLANQAAAEGLALVYANPAFRIREEQLPASHPICARLKTQSMFSLDAAQENFDALITENGVVQGSFAFFALGDIGFLKLHSTVRKTPFSPKELYQLRNVVLQFTVSLEGCLSHERVVWEINERKSAEKALSESEKRYRFFFEDNPSMYFTLDTTGNVVAVNEFGARQLGYTEDELIGQPVLKVFYEEDKPKVLEQFTQCLQNPGGIHQWQLRKVRKDGSMLWVEEFARCVTRADGTTNVLIVCQDVTERKKAEEQIKASLQEKEVLLKEIHHRVKNNMQVMSSLLSMQAEYIKDPETLRLFKESSTRIKSMALIHEKLYQTESLSRVNFAEYIPSLANYLLISNSRHSYPIRLRLNVEDISFEVDTAIPCGLIVNELVLNALKHAFPDDVGGHEIRITFCRHVAPDSGERRYVLTVGDNGVGVPEHFDFTSSLSLGLKLVTSLVKQLRGAIRLRRGEGTEFEIEFVQG